MQLQKSLCTRCERFAAESRLPVYPAALGLILCLALTIVAPAGSADCRIRRIASGPGTDGTIVEVDRDICAGLTGRSRASVWRFDPHLGQTSSIAELAFHDENDEIVRLRVYNALSPVRMNEIVTYRHDFRDAAQLQAHSGTVSTIAGLFTHDGSGSEAVRQRVFSELATKDRNRPVYALSAIEVPPAIHEGAPVPVSIHYAAASHVRRSALPASLEVRMLSSHPAANSVTLAQTQWQVAGGGGVGSLEGNLALPDLVPPGTYLLEFTLGGEGFANTVERRVLTIRPDPIGPNAR